MNLASRFLRFHPSQRGFPQPYRSLLDRLTTVGTWAAVIAVVVQTTLHLIGALRGISFLSANSENNPIAWSHGVAIFATAFVAVLHAVSIDHKRGRFIVIAAILAFLSLDEVVSIHERIAAWVLEELQLSRVWDSVLWPVIYLPLAGILALFLLRVASDAPRPAGRAILFGLGLLVASVVAEVVSAPWSTGENVVHTIEGAFEEGAEIAGWILITTGLTTTTISAIVSVRPE